MNADQNDIERDFWDFSVATYMTEGVSDACLQLQDKHDIDVNILLHLCWVAKRYDRAADDDYIARLMVLTDEWTAHVVKGLRGVRRYLKTLLDSDEPFARYARDHRKAVLERELEAERAEQHVLARTAAEHFGMPDKADAGSARFAREAIERYFDHKGAQWDRDDEAALETVLNAAFADRSA